MIKNKQKVVKKYIIFIICLTLLSLCVLYIYNTYVTVNIASNYNAEKIQSTNVVENVDTAKENSTSVADMLENVIESVVGISKLKNTGSSIFSNSSESELGLGTGVIVSEDGYILSNSHVTGEKYSICYITLENGITYDRNCGVGG